MKPTLQVRLSQHLALTPQLQQSIRLLQLSTLELHQEIGQMLDQNPFLDVDADGDDGTPESVAYGLERVATETGRDAQEVERRHDAEAERAESSDGEPAPIGADDFGTPERDDWANGTEGDDFDGIRESPSLAGAGTGSGDGDGDADTMMEAGGEASLADHLHAQVGGMRLAPEDAVAVHLLIDSLDDDGYLADPLEAIAARLARDLGLGDDPAADDAAQAERREDLGSRLRCALRWLQSLEPTGVGAASLGECLDLQLRRHDGAVAAACVARTIASHHLELLARRDVKRLVAATGADEAVVREAHALILGCEPKPGRRFARAEANVIVPDVIVRRAGRGWRAVLNPDVMPKLRINDVYAQAIRGQRGEAAAGMSSRLQEARWFVRNILQRFDTIQRVSQAIVERQKAFFTHGALAMKPLVLREIAEELELHESTISRVTTAKYMATPHGTFELKYFFGSGLATEAGGNASSTAVRALIRQFIGSEPAAQPLSDNQLAEMLAEQGIQVARRTVAKYREGMKIASASLRRAL